VSPTITLTPTPCPTLTPGTQWTPHPTPVATTLWRRRSDI
jgi:hypothetical protein